jgi:hypothetical protein
MTMAALRHPPHPVDACHRTTGPHCMWQEISHTPRGTLPRRTQPRTQSLCDHDPLTYTHAVVTWRLSPLVVHVPQTR